MEVLAAGCLEQFCLHTLELCPLTWQAHKTELIQVLLQASPCKALPCRALGSVAWFPVHCTSINNTNQLISGDNKGVASQLMEVWARTNVSDTAAEGWAWPGGCIWAEQRW